MIINGAPFRSIRGMSKNATGLVAVIEGLVNQLGVKQTCANEDIQPKLVQKAIIAAVQAEQRIKELTDRIAQLETVAATDEMTRVLNRRGFESEVRRALAAANRYGETGMLIYVDLDGFKQINDKFGHAAGDAALCHVAGLLTANVRCTDSVGRLGGDEFAVLLTRITAENGMRRTEELAALLDPATMIWNDVSIPVHASLGAEAYGANIEHTVNDLLIAADRCMYGQKWQRNWRIPERAVA